MKIKIKAADKIKDKRGETLVEALCAILVIALSMLMLSGAIVASANLNKSTESLNTAFSKSNAKGQSGVTVTITHSSGSSDQLNVNGYRTDDDNDYCYYEK